MLFEPEALVAVVVPQASMDTAVNVDDGTYDLQLDGESIVAANSWLTK